MAASKLITSQTFDKAAFYSLFSSDGGYYLAFSLLFGTTVWNTFGAGPIAVKNLPRQQFGALQAKQFPIVFGLSTSLSGFLLAKWIFNHPEVTSHSLNVSNVDVLQAWTLATVTVMHSLNLFYWGPKTRKVMFERQRQEKAEGKSSRDADISNELKALNKKFGMVHGVSSLVNLIAVLGTGFHGLWVANHGF